MLGPNPRSSLAGLWNLSFKKVHNSCTQREHQTVGETVLLDNILHYYNIWIAYQGVCLFQLYYPALRKYFPEVVCRTVIIVDFSDHCGAGIHMRRVSSK